MSAAKQDKNKRDWTEGIDVESFGSKKDINKVMSLTDGQIKIAFRLMDRYYAMQDAMVQAESMGIDLEKFSMKDYNDMAEKFEEDQDSVTPDIITWQTIIKERLMEKYTEANA